MAPCVTRRHINRFGIQKPALSSLLGLQLLTTVLELIAGSLDVISFLGPSRMFTEHVTGIWLSWRQTSLAVAQLSSRHYSRYPSSYSHSV
jgi:hypothetical protein